MKWSRSVNDGLRAAWCACGACLASLIVVACPSPGRPGAVPLASTPASRPATGHERPVAVRVQREEAAPSVPAEAASPAPDRKLAQAQPDYAYGKWVRFELCTDDPDGAGKFYASLLDWTVTPDEGGTIVQSGGREIARIGTCDQDRARPRGWLGFLSVEDVDDMLRDVTSNGGRILEAAEDVQVGRMALVAGPTGAIFAVVHASGGDALDGNMVPGDWYWNQLWTTNLDEGLRFYSAIASYTSIEVTYGALRYEILQNGQLPRAVIREAPAGEVSRWIPFVYVMDVKAVVAKAKRLGAQIVTEPRDVESMGRVAAIKDPTGGLMGFITPDPGKPVGE